MKAKSFFVCSECGYRSPRWIGKCPMCNEWNTFVEEVEKAAPKQTKVVSRESAAVPYTELTAPTYMRSTTGLSELDRVLGGGLVSGSVVLISGEPGIGKSTLLMQISDALGREADGVGRRIMYVSGEESQGQLKMRADRLGVKGDGLFILTETDVDRVLEQVDSVRPDILIVDSVQTMYRPDTTSTPGSITQVRECTLSFIAKAKSEGLSTILVGHVNKDGNIAGPKVLEHMVDAVLYFEGERRQQYRIIRAIKNRYGSTNEIGVFQMTDRGLDQVPNPSEMLLAGRPKSIPGNCAVCTIEGTRPIIAEIQALVTPTVFPAPRRTSNGIDYNRLCLILAVLEKRLGLRFSQHDVYLNVIGGLTIDEPAADLAIAMALVSSLTDRVVPDDLIVIGELGLAGECRAVSEIDHRIKEASRLGFTQAVVPENNRTEKIPSGISVSAIRGVYQALSFLKAKDENNI